MKITEILKYIEENTNSAFFYTPNIYQNGKSYLFKKPYKILKGKTEDEVESLFNKVDELSQNTNLIGFATVPYEIGYYFQPKKIKDSYLGKSEIKFLFYEKKDVEIINSNTINFENAEKFFGTKSAIHDLKLEITENEYVEKINKIKNYIEKGDTYQINFTTKAKFKFDGNLTSLFLNGIFNQSASYSVIINDETDYIFSFSPELFFRTDYKTIYSRPMKGTVERKGDPKEDEKLRYALMNDEKNLAENVMIVDLMRNDIGRIAVTDSVEVKKLYQVEKYETLYQLTSTVAGKLKEGKVSEIFKNLFPSGSITGAPKIRSMQIIAELEESPRNLYTGSIGLITDSSTTFNIPIRTLSINKKTKKGELGLGSGIVWDSDAGKEYDEVLLKGQFITSPPNYFELLETMLYENGEIFLWDYHLDRLKKSADYFLFQCDENKLKIELNNIILGLLEHKTYKLRVLISKWGNIKITSEEISQVNRKMKIILDRSTRCDSDEFLYNKTTYRPWGDHLNLALQKGYDEILFVNENEELIEGAMTNLLVKLKGKMYTPPTQLALLNGCYRQYLLDSSNCSEKILTIDDLKNSEEVSLINSVRKKNIVSNVYDPEEKIIFSNHS